MRNNMLPDGFEIDSEFEKYNVRFSLESIKKYLFNQSEDFYYEKFIDSFIERKFLTPIELHHIHSDHTIQRGSLWFQDPSKYHILRPYYIMVSETLIENPDKIEPMFYLKTIDSNNVDLQKIQFSMNNYKEVLGKAYDSEGFLFFINSIFYVPHPIFVEVDLE